MSSDESPTATGEGSPKGEPRHRYGVRAEGHTVPYSDTLPNGHTIPYSHAISYAGASADGLTDSNARGRAFRGNASCDPGSHACLGCIADAHSGGRDLLS